MASVRDAAVAAATTAAEYRRLIHLDDEQRCPAMPNVPRAPRQSWHKNQPAPLKASGNSRSNRRAMNQVKAISCVHSHYSKNSPGFGEANDPMVGAVTWHSCRPVADQDFVNAALRHRWCSATLAVIAGSPGQPCFAKRTGGVGLRGVTAIDFAMIAEAAAPRLSCERARRAPRRASRCGWKR